MEKNLDQGRHVTWLENFYDLIVVVQSKWCAIAHNRSICCGCKSMRPRNGSQFMSGSVFTF